MDHHEEIWNTGQNHKKVKSFYEDFQCVVEDQGEVGEWFNIKTGVKQRYHLCLGLCS